MKNLFPKSGFVLFSLSLLLLSPHVTMAADKWWQGGAGTANNSSANWYPTDAVTTLTTLATTDRAIFSVGASAAAFTIAGTPTATGGLTVEDGTVTLGGTWGAFGAAPLQVNSGATLVIGLSTTIPTTAGSVLTLNGGRMRNSNTGTSGSFVDIDTTITLGTGGGIISGTGGAAAQTIIQPTSIISGTGPLTKDGNAIISIAAACTYSGATIINDGTLRIRTTSNRLPIGTDVTLNSPGALDPGSTGEILQQVNTINGNGNITYSANSILLIAGSGDSTLTGVISDGASTSGRIAKHGAGTLTLSGVNTYDGRFTNGAGTTTITSAGTWCGALCDVYVNGGIVNLNNAAQTVRTLTGAGGTMNLGTGHVLTTDPALSSTYSGTVAGLGGLTKANVVSGGTMRTLTLSGPNTYDGNTLVNGGNISVGSATALGSTAGYTEVASGAELLFTGAGVNFTCNEPIRIAGAGNSDNGAIAVIASASPTLSGPVTLIGDTTITVSSSASATFNNANAITSLANQSLTLQGGANASGVKAISGIINLGTGGLTKLEGGKWELSGANVYSGGTLVSAGTLIVNNTTGSGTGSGAVTVNSGATLGGNGTISGAVTVSGTLAPGTSIGTLTLGVAPSLGGTVAMEINKATGPVLTGDKLVVSTGGGALVYAGTLTVTASGNPLALGDTFDLFDADSFSGAFTATNLPGLPAGLAWDASQLTVNGTISVVCDGTLTASAGSDQTICSGTGVIIGDSPTASGGSGSGYTYSWTPGTGLSSTTVANPTASPTTTTIYTVTVTDANSCVSAGDSVTVTVESPATVNAGPDQTICAGSTVQLAGSFGGAATSVTWSGGAGSFSPDNTSPTAVYTPSAGEISAGTVTLTLTTDDPTGPCNAVNDTVTITINSVPTISSQPSPQTVCSGASASFSVTAAGGGLNYAWRKRGAGWGTGNEWQLATSGGGSGGFFTADSANNGSGSSGNINTGGKAWGMFANGGATAAAVRSFGSGMAAGQTFSIDMDNGFIDGGGKVGFQLRNASGEVVWEFSFTGGDSTYQINGVNLSPTIAFTADGLRIAVTLTSATTYSAVVTTPLGGSSQTYTGNLQSPAGGQTITQTRLYNQNAGNNSSNDAFFNSIGVGAYDDNASTYSGWSNTDNLGNGPLANTGNISGATTATLTINPTSAGDAASYDVVVSNTCGQTNSTPAALTVNPLPTIALGANPVVCFGTTSASLPYTATTGSPDQYSINFDAAAEAAGFVDVTLASLPASPITITVPGAAAAGTYNATLTVRISETGCTDSGSAITVTVNPVATVGAGPDQLIQSGSAATLAGSFGGGATSATWSGGSGTFVPDNTTPTASYTPSAGEDTAGTVTLTLTTDDPAGPCPAVSDSVTITINHAPVANNTNTARMPGLSIKIKIADLLAGFTSDVDGDARTLQSVGTPNNGGTVTTDATFIYYSNPSDVADSFTYTVSDGRGGTATASVGITMADKPAGTATSINTSGGGPVTVKFAGIPTYHYDVERSTDLMTWTTVASDIEAASNGAYEYIDNTPPQPTAYYRSRQH